MIFVPTCTVFCQSAPTVPTNAHISDQSTGVYLEGTNVTIQCNNVPHAELTTVCHSNRSWSPLPSELDCTMYSTSTSTSPVSIGNCNYYNCMIWVAKSVTRVLSFSYWRQLWVIDKCSYYRWIILECLTSVYHPDIDGYWHRAENETIRWILALKCDILAANNIMLLNVITHTTVIGVKSKPLRFVGFNSDPKLFFMISFFTYDVIMKRSRYKSGMYAYNKIIICDQLCNRKWDFY